MGKVSQRYAAHGTVQVTIRVDSLDVTFSPIADYRVKHKERDYTVLVALDSVAVPRSYIIGVEETYTTVDSQSLRDALRQAAIAGTRVEIEVEFDPSNKGKVVAMRIPATPAKP